MNDVCQHRVTAYAAGMEGYAVIFVDGAVGEFVFYGFVYCQWFFCEYGFVYIRFVTHDNIINGNVFAGLDMDHIIYLNLV